MKYVLCALFFIWIMPRSVDAAVRITEVAWMGTEASQYSEWLELYNDGEDEVHLAGWKLYEGDGGALVFTLTKSISAHGYLLIERTTASAPDAVPGINDEAGSFGGGGFANTGEDLVLKDSTGSTVDELDFVDGWPAGDATTKATMQLRGEKWVTADPTPKAPTGGSVTSGDEESTEEVIEEENDPFPIPKVSPNKPGIVFTTPQLIYRGIAYQFSAEPVLEYNFRLNKGTIYWNFGDGATVRQTEVVPITHTYAYPGMYTMYYAYTDAITRVALTGTKKIKVIEPTLSIALVGATALELNNTSSTPVDLSGWMLSADGRYAAIPDMTIVSEKSKAVISLSALGIPSASTVHVIDPSGSIVATTEKVATPHTSVSSVSESDESEPIVDELVANAAEVEEKPQSKTPIHNRTKTIIFGAVVLFVIGLSILLERARARREYL